MQNQKNTVKSNTVKTVTKGIANLNVGAVFTPTSYLNCTMQALWQWVLNNANGNLAQCVVQLTPYFKSLSINNWQQFINHAALSAVPNGINTSAPVNAAGIATNMLVLQYMCILFGVQPSSINANGKNSKSFAVANLVSVPYWGAYNGATVGTYVPTPKTVSHTLASMQNMLKSVGGQALMPNTSAGGAPTFGQKNSIGGGNTVLQLLAGTSSSTKPVFNKPLIQIAVAPSISSK